MCAYVLSCFFEFSETVKYEQVQFRDEFPFFLNISTVVTSTIISLTSLVPKKSLFYNLKFFLNVHRNTTRSILILQQYFKRFCSFNFKYRNTDRCNLHIQKHFGFFNNFLECRGE